MVMASESPEDTMAQQNNNSTAWGEEEEGWSGAGAVSATVTAAAAAADVDVDAATAADADADADAADNHGSNTEHSDQQVEEPSVSIDPVLNSSGDSASIDEDSGEYDPESVTLTTSVLPPIVERSASVASSSRPSKKPKTAGGFLVGSSDDEDEDDAPIPIPLPTTNPNADATSSTLMPAPAEAQPRPLTHSPLQQSTTPQELSTTGTYGHAPAQASTVPIPASLHGGLASASAASAKSRLPTDIVGILEDRVKEDPRGDIDAWLALIDEQKRRHKIDDSRAAYERFLKIFPQTADIWVAYLDMELSLDNFAQAESIFGRTLLSVPNVQLWTAYLNYIRRRNDLNDPTGQARQTVSQSYEFVLDNIGQDRDAGSIWQDYINFVKNGPGQVGGSSWQDQQKMDLLRKAYQRAICIPMGNLNSLWKEYDLFELGLNKMTGRKFLQERSPAYMTARSANTHLDNITRGLQRTNLPRLPPAPGFDGDQEFLEQVGLWKAWISWEKEDPLVLKAEDPETYRQRVLHVYKQALMALRFWPEMWVDAAEWCFENNIFSKDGQNTGLQFLLDGIAANPESSLLALKHADRIELTQRAGEDDEAKAALAQAVRAPYDKVLETLYDMIKKLKDREAAAIAKIEEEVTSDISLNGGADVDDEDDEGEIKENPSPESTKKDRVKAVQDGFAVQIQMLSQQISYLWIALARAYRRLQGQGKGSPPVGVRGIFTEARQKGRLTSDVYLAIAHIEWDIYQDPVATKIFERGSRLFPEQEHFIVEYLKHLHARRDFTNARVVFSQTVKRFKEKQELLPKLKPLFAYFHGYEARFGELAQVKDLEKQMTELFPEESNVAHFSARFSTERFNPVTARVIISPAQQMRPKNVMQSVERPSPSVRSSPQPVPQVERSPRPQFLPLNTNSPKRPFQADDQDDYNPPRKLARGNSPLKGAAGRRLDQQRRAQHGQGTSTQAITPAPIARDITFLLGLMPPAEAFNAHRFSPNGIVQLLRDTTVPDFAEWKNRSESMSRVHNRQASSSEYPPYSFSGRDSPGVSGRPISPYGGTSRGPPPSSAPYRNSPLRPGSSGSYEPPPAVYQGPGPSQFNPIAHAPATAPAPDGGFAAWQNAYASASSQYGLPPTGQAPPYSGYY
ncbi:hypothetical protein F4810DRAFT_46450 [Camillea tinctor]|nr:hypothetical protein F4810DRAFT_46450 [Camillea tinctor]